MVTVVPISELSPVGEGIVSESAAPECHGGAKEKLEEPQPGEPEHQREIP